MVSKRELPITFGSKQQRQAAIAGSKTQTRRVIMPQPEVIIGDPNVLSDVCRARTLLNAKYQVGDHLWLREPYQIEYLYGQDLCVNGFRGLYSDDSAVLDVIVTKKDVEKFCKRTQRYRKSPSLFMYKSLARYWFVVTGVRCELLQDITDVDAEREGVVPSRHRAPITRNTTSDHAQSLLNRFSKYRDGFITLWDCHAKPEQKWENNPWVFVYEFKRIKK